MPTISYDGQSLSIDGRRVWLVSGAIPYARVPHELWRDRIRAARQAGLNCIETPVFWNLHEPAPGKFNFTGDADLRRFVKLLGEEGMFCILRPGPFINTGWDFGGLPAWLNTLPEVRLREANGPFLEACARYLGAVMEQVRDLQVSSSAPPKVAAKMPGGGGGPILLMQAEHEWMCDHPQQADKYLVEIVRYLRENGASCPIFECNNLWTQVEGAFSAWNANQHLSADLRQLRLIQPDAPLLVSEYWTGERAHWGEADEPAGETIDAGLHEFRLAGIMAAGAQVNLVPFHGGTNFGFHAGRDVAARAAFVTTSHDCDAPLGEAGGRGEKYFATRRLCTFASQFSHVFAQLDADHHTATIAPDEGEHPVAVLHQRGQQGDVIFLIRSERDRTDEARVLLPGGQTLPVTLGKDRVAWLLLNAKLAGVAELSFTNLRPWALIAREMLVLFGPAGSQGLVAINGAPLGVKVPTGKSPVVVRHEDLTVAVLNREQVDAAYIAGDKLVVGVASLDENDEPRPLRGWPQITTIAGDGNVATARIAPPKRITAPRLAKWQVHVPETFIDGSSEHFRDIEGPASLEMLGASQGYGWYRIENKARRIDNVMAPRGGDRLHVYQAGKLAALIGEGPDAQNDAVRLRLDGATVVLADQLGRFADGWRMGEPKGIADHLFAVKQVRLGKPKIEHAAAPDLFEWRGFLRSVRAHERPTGSHLTWTVKPVGRNPLLVDITAPFRAALLVNDELVGAYDPHWSAGFVRFVLPVGEPLKAAENRITLAAFEVIDTGRRFEAAKAIRIWQATGNVTARATWSFAPWSLPDGDAFGTMKQPPGVAAFYRTTFNVSRTEVPLWLEPRGLTKGQIHLNGRNVGRYFNATRTGKPVGPQSRYYLPEPWLRTDAPNDLILFDEHGKPPAQVKLVYGGD